MDSKAFDRENRANARLIAKAPEMLALLRIAEPSPALSHRQADQWTERYDALLAEISALARTHRRSGDQEVGACHKK